MLFRINKEKKTNQKTSKGYEDVVPKWGKHNSYPMREEIHNIISY